MPLVRSLRKVLARFDEALSHLDVDTHAADQGPPRARYDEIVGVRSLHRSARCRRAAITSKFTSPASRGR